MHSITERFKTRTYKLIGPQNNWANITNYKYLVVNFHQVARFPEFNLREALC